MEIVGNLLGVSIGGFGEFALALAVLSVLGGAVLLRRAAALELREIRDRGLPADAELSWD